MVTQGRPLSAAEELAALHNGVAECQRNLAALPGYPGLTPQQRQQYAAQAHTYLGQASARIAQLTGRAAPTTTLATLPQAHTPNEATKAARKLKRQAKKQKRMNKRMKGMATSAIASLPAGSPLIPMANVLVDETADPTKRTEALHALVDAVPINSPAAPIVKGFMKEFMDDDDDDDDED